jgi:hypothetical protein
MPTGLWCKRMTCPATPGGQSLSEAASWPSGLVPRMSHCWHLVRSPDELEMA